MWISANVKLLCFKKSFDFYQSNMHKCKKGEVNKSLRSILESFLLVVSRDAQWKRLFGAEIISSSAWTTAFTACCRPRHPLKVSNGAGVYPVPHPAQLVTVLSHRKHCCFCAYYMWIGPICQQKLSIWHLNLAYWRPTHYNITSDRQRRVPVKRRSIAAYRQALLCGAFSRGCAATSSRSRRSLHRTKMLKRSRLVKTRRLLLRIGKKMRCEISKKRIVMPFLRDKPA